MREKSTVLWLVLIVVFITVINLPSNLTDPLQAATREGLAPLQELLSSYAHRARSAVSTIRGWGGLLEESQQLGRENAVLKTQVRELESLHQENFELRQQLAFAQQHVRNLVPAEVIARDISGWWHTVRLGKGAMDGLAVDQAVVTTDGLVGKVVNVSAHTSDVLLISDPSCRVSVFIPTAASFGVLSGKGLSWKGRILGTLDLVNKDSEIRKGDEVVTSGLGGVFPKSLLIGYVDSVRLDESGLYQQADLLPVADLGALHYVFVIAGQDPIDALLERMHTRGPEEEGP